MCISFLICYSSFVEQQYVDNAANKWIAVIIIMTSYKQQVKTQWVSQYGILFI